MNLLHVVPHISKEASGPSYSVPRLCQSLAAINNNVTLACLATNREVPGVTLDVHAQWPMASRFAISPSLSAYLGRRANTVDIVHNHSLWSMVNMSVGWVVPGKRAKLVVSPRGTLSPWALSRSKAIKSLLWPIQRRALQRADLLHATSEAELFEIRAEGFTAPVVLLQNGVDLPDLPNGQSFSVNDERALLYLGRIHPIKGLDRLLEAWSRLEEHHPKWRLTIAGTGESDHVKEILDLAEHLKLQRVYFPGPMYGIAKSQAYFSSSLFVLPTHSENFGMVVAEALAHGCPVVVSKGAPWSLVEQNQCGWWVENDVFALAATLDRAMRTDHDRLISMGLLGRGWMDRDFGWTNIGEKMNDAYAWLLAGADRSRVPSHISYC